jgi:hypothetical protein
MSDPTQKKLEVKSVGYKIGIAESERSLSNLGQTLSVPKRPNNRGMPDVIRPSNCVQGLSCIASLLGFALLMRR